MPHLCPPPRDQQHHPGAESSVGRAVQFMSLQARCVAREHPVLDRYARTRFTKSLPP